MTSLITRNSNMHKRRVYKPTAKQAALARIHARGLMTRVERKRHSVSVLCLCSLVAFAHFGLVQEASPIGRVMGPKQVKQLFLCRRDQAAVMWAKKFTADNASDEEATEAQVFRLRAQASARRQARLHITRQNARMAGLEVCARPLSSLSLLCSLCALQQALAEVGDEVAGLHAELYKLRCCTIVPEQQDAIQAAIDIAHLRCELREAKYKLLPSYIYKVATHKRDTGYRSE